MQSGEHGHHHHHHHYSGMQELQQLSLEKGIPLSAPPPHLRMFALDVLSQSPHFASALKPPRMHSHGVHPCVPFSLDHHFHNHHALQEHLHLTLGDDSFSQRNSIQESEDEEGKGLAPPHEGNEDKNDGVWSSEETLALVRIRSEPDLNFTESAPWEVVSRRLCDLGYRRGAGECKEKCEELILKSYQDKSCLQFSELEAVYNKPGKAAVQSEASLPEEHTTSEKQQTSETPTTINKKKRKRKAQNLTSIKTFLEKMVKQLLESQEELHRKFIEIVEMRDKERIEREEAWRRQEMERRVKETDIRAQERVVTNAREAAIVRFLQKFTGQTIDMPETQIVPYEPPCQTLAERDFSDPNSKRWPKPEVQALIRLRSKLEPRFQESGPKGALWQEISDGMAALGYPNRSSKRCKEKWENINKYFRKTKDSMKKRPENAKTCPYFHQLDMLYRKGVLSSPNKSSCKLEPSQDYSELNNSENNNGVGMKTSAEQSGKMETDNSEEVGSLGRTDCAHQHQQRNFLQDFQKEEKEAMAAHQASQSTAQSALMALVDKFTSEMESDYPLSNASRGGFV